MGENEFLGNSREVSNVKKESIQGTAGVGGIVVKMTYF
jgi:hypothetical protein